MPDQESKSFRLARPLLGQTVEVIIDRPLGSKHAKFGFEYLANYGYVAGVIAPDGEELDAYYLGTTEAIDKATGIVIAIVHRLEDDDDKLIVTPMGVSLTEQQIELAIEFQEKWFKHELIVN